HQGDKSEKAQHGIPDIDLVIVDLYPFEETVASGAEEQDIIEKIDIGGISLIRAAAKNFRDVVIVASREGYPAIQAVLDSKNGETSLADRKSFAARAFAMSSHYDTAIFNYFNQTEQLASFRYSSNGGHVLRYGENPHQKAMFHGN